jgi:hypothetical protein
MAEQFGGLTPTFVCVTLEAQSPSRVAMSKIST